MAGAAAWLPFLGPSPERITVQAAPARTRPVSRSSPTRRARSCRPVVPDHDAGPREGVAHLLRIGLGRAHGAVLGGEDKLGPGGIESVGQVRLKGRRDRDRVGVATLRRGPVVGTRHRDRARAQVHVRPAEPEQLALAHARVDRRGEQVAPVGWDVGEQQRDLLGLERRVGALRDGSMLHVDVDQYWSLAN